MQCPQPQLLIQNTAEQPPLPRRAIGWSWHLGL